MSGNTVGWFNCCLAPHLVDLVERDGVAAALLGQDLRDGSREGGLAVVNMANGADVEVGLPGAEESESALRHSNRVAGGSPCCGRRWRSRERARRRLQGHQLAG